MVIPEAMVCGLPILSTKCTGPTEILYDGEYGILVENNDDSIYKGMKEVLTQKESLMYYKRQSLKRYRCYVDDIVINEIIKLFH